jgi:murein DD-endopeptidase MepM/ murein hydrolase activator NlpD
MAYSAEHDELTRRIAAEVFTGNPDTARVFYNMIRQECGFDLDVISGLRDSPAGARGIAQLMPVHWSRVDPLDPPAALRYAGAYLRDLAARYRDLRAGVAAYNWGPGNLDALIASRGANWETAPELPAETGRFLVAAFAGAPAAGDTALHRDPTTGWLVPAAGPITQGFGPTDEPLDGPATYRGVTYPHFNRGIDIGCPPGTNVFAATAGTVIWAGPRNRQGQPVLDGTGWGITVWVQQPDGVIHNYGHLDGVDVSVGDLVKRGTLLGRSGNTGASTGPHLSYDVFRLAAGELEPIDPASYLASAAPDDRMPGSPAAWATATVIAVDGLRLRAGPSDDATVLAVAPHGTRVLLPRAAWYPVLWDGREGWMWGELLSPEHTGEAAHAIVRRVLAWADGGDGAALAALAARIDELSGG